MNIYTDNNKIIYKFDDKDDYESLLVIFKNLKKPTYNSDLKNTIDTLYNIILNRYDEKDNTIYVCCSGVAVNALVLSGRCYDNQSRCYTWTVN